jgi:aspartate carbamoyltransferase catalytic subunit
VTEAAASLGKDLVGLEGLSAEQIRTILDTAEPFKEISERRIKKVPVLRGKTIVNLFFEASTRTRISFEFAEKRLSADTVNISSTGSSVVKGETLVDTARNLEAMRIDMVVIRHGSSGAARFLAERIPSTGSSPWAPRLPCAGRRPSCLRRRTSSACGSSLASRRRSNGRTC